jgi:hypothetical protein
MERQKPTTSLDSSRRRVLIGGAAIVATAALTAAIAMVGVTALTNNESTHRKTESASNA